jgi:hypothetical protein
MLQAYEIVAIEIQEIGGPLIGGNVFLRQLQAHLFRIVVARIGIVDGNGKQAPFSVFGCERGAQVGRESSNAALPRQIIPNERNARGKGRRLAFNATGKEADVRVLPACVSERIFRGKTSNPLSNPDSLALEIRCTISARTRGTGSTLDPRAPRHSAYLAGTAADASRR